MTPQVSIEGVREPILSLGDKFEKAKAIGICGSLAGGDFHERSTIGRGKPRLLKTDITHDEEWSGKGDRERQDL